MYGMETSEGIDRIAVASVGFAVAVRTDVAVGGVAAGVMGEMAAGTAAATSAMTPRKVAVGAVGTTKTCAVEAMCWIQAVLASRMLQTGSRDWTGASRSPWR